MQRWCQLYLDQDFYVSIRTNNGLESLNSTLKRLYLEPGRKHGSLSSLAKVIVEEYLPSVFKSYVVYNHRASSNHKQYKTEVNLAFLSWILLWFYHIYFAFLLIFENVMVISYKYMILKRPAGCFHISRLSLAVFKLYHQHFSVCNKVKWRKLAGCYHIMGSFEN